MEVEDFIIRALTHKCNMGMRLQPLLQLYIRIAQHLEQHNLHDHLRDSLLKFWGLEGNYESFVSVSALEVWWNIILTDILEKLFIWSSLLLFSFQQVWSTMLNEVFVLRCLLMPPLAQPVSETVSFSVSTQVFLYVDTVTVIVIV